MSPQVYRALLFTCTPPPPQFVRPASEWMASEWREKQWYIEALHRDTEGTRTLKEEYRKELVPRQGLIERYN